jgi:AraC-like DNA-binding protein
MPSEENAKLWSVPHLNGLTLLRADFVTYAFKRHMHDYFVIGMIEAGVQKFSYQRDVFITPPTGLIIINPGEAHTGEAAVASGFRYRALYPDPDLLQHIASQVKGRSQDIPFFSYPVIHDAVLFKEIYHLHLTLESAVSALEQESRYIEALARLIIRHADTHPQVKSIGRERHEIKRVCAYIEDNFAQDVKLSDLASLVHWNPFYLLRVFRAEMGLPPHAYLETVRIREGQALLKKGRSLAQTAYETGFSSQSHFTTTFKRLIGVTPGHYAQQVNFLKDTSHQEAYAEGNTFTSSGVSDVYDV